LIIKRDDQTGLAFGGNKARKLEFILADALEKGADSIVTWAGVQSNWCRQVAAGASQLGLRTVLVLVNKPGAPIRSGGNLLLDRIFNADIRVVEGEEGKSFLELENVLDLVSPAMEEEKAAGRSPYLAPVGGSLLEGSMDRPLGALGYVVAFIEMYQQAVDRGMELGSVVLATGSAGTQAGLLVGAKLLSPRTRIVGISVAAPAGTVARYVTDIANRTFQELGRDLEVGSEEVVVLDDYLDKGYGVLNQPVTDAVARLAREEGILLDPVYTGKSMAGLMDLGGKGFFKEGERVVFLHTGGTPALFPYQDDLLGFLDD
jgi:D-cysteine desulfhydrase family pyridoxal phosphate-dependent enzyme